MVSRPKNNDDMSDVTEVLCVVVFNIPPTPIPEKIRAKYLTAMMFERMISRPKNNDDASDIAEVLCVDVFNIPRTATPENIRARSHLFQANIEAYWSCLKQ